MEELGKKPQKSWAFIGDIVAIGDLPDLKGLGLVPGSTSVDRDTDVYFTDLMIVVTPPRDLEGSWFDDGDQVVLCAELKSDFLELYRHFRSNDRYKVAIDFAPGKEEELLKLMLGIED